MNKLMKHFIIWFVAFTAITTTSGTHGLNTTIKETLERYNEDEDMNNRIYVNQ